MVQNPGVSLFTLNYNNSGKDFFSTTYKVYWRAINDVQTNVYQQKLFIGTGLNGILTGTLKDFGYKDVPVKLYDEVYLGDVVITQAGSLDFISLIAANSTTNGNNSLTLDYLKFVPVLK